MVETHPHSQSATAPQHASTVLEVRDLSVHAAAKPLLSGIHLNVAANEIFGLIGPSGAGKSTLLRCLNRLIDLDPTLRVAGDVLLHGRSIRAPEIDPDALRVRIGILFQQPVIFPMSIVKNVLFGVRHLGNVPHRDQPALAERALRETALWDEVKDRLHAPATKLSVGQQQRLCLARTLAVDPEVILMDEPTSALDPRSTQAIEDLIASLKTQRTVVLVTHNLAQARRLCDRVAFLTAQTDGIGRIACTGPVESVLSQTSVPELRDYLNTDTPPTLDCCAGDPCCT